MRAFKNLDYFRKVSPEHTRPTAIGGIVSVLSLASIMALFFLEVNEYVKPHIQKDTFIAQDPHEGQFVTMNIDITFPNAPCYMIDIEVASSIATSDMSRQDLIKRRLNSKGELVSSPEPDFSDPSQAAEQIYGHIQDGEKCHIKGKMHLYRVTGKVLFSFNSKLFYIEELIRRHPDVGNSLKLTHTIKSLTFGDVAQHLHILFRFGANEHTQFDMVNMVDDEVYANDQEKKDYFYFLKLVPHIFVDEINSAIFRSYSYSLNHNSKASQNGIGMISMIYDFTPVNMKITKQNKDLPRFLVSLCAIVGGVFVIFGLVNRFLLTVQESVFSRKI